MIKFIRQMTAVEYKIYTKEKRIKCITRQIDLLIFNCQFLLLSSSLIGGGNFRCSCRSLRQRVNCQYTVDVNELATYTLPGSSRFRICITCGIDLKSSEFIGNKSTLYMYIYDYRLVIEFMLVYHFD